MFLVVFVTFVASAIVRSRLTAARADRKAPNTALPAGATVVSADRDGDGAAATASSIGGTARTVDVSQRAEVDALVAEFKKRFP